MRLIFMVLFICINLFSCSLFLDENLTENEEEFVSSKILDDNGYVLGN